MKRGESTTGSVPPHVLAREKERGLAWQKKFWFYADLSMIGLLVVSMALTTSYAYMAGVDYGNGEQGFNYTMMWCFVILMALSFCYVMIRFFDNQYLASKRIVIRL